MSHFLRFHLASSGRPPHFVGGRLGLAAVLLFACFAVLAPAGVSGGEVVTEPRMRYGLNSLECAAYCPNPEMPLIATGGGMGVVLWDAETGEQRRILDGAGHFVDSVAFSPDGALESFGHDAVSATDSRTNTSARKFLCFWQERGIKAL